MSWYCRLFKDITLANIWAESCIKKHEQNFGRGTFLKEETWETMTQLNINIKVCLKELELIHLLWVRVGFSGYGDELHEIQPNKVFSDLWWFNNVLKTYLVYLIRCVFTYNRIPVAWLVISRLITWSAKHRMRWLKPTVNLCLFWCNRCELRLKHRTTGLIAFQFSF